MGLLTRKDEALALPLLDGICMGRVGVMTDWLRDEKGVVEAGRAMALEVTGGVEPKDKEPCGESGVLLLSRKLDAQESLYGLGAPGCEQLGHVGGQDGPQAGGGAAHDLLR
jgi:hypothetical protein